MQKRPVMIIDDEANYISGSDLGTDITINSRYIVHTYHNGARNNVEYGADSLDDAMEWLRSAIALPVPWEKHSKLKYGTVWPIKSFLLLRNIKAVRLALSK
jgi:hypothetical protein